MICDSARSNLPRIICIRAVRFNKKKYQMKNAIYK